VKLSIIIPVYNEEQTIGTVVERVLAVNLGDLDSEIIIADDGSSDRTREAIASSGCLGDPRVRVYSNRINVGKGCAVRLGLSYASGDIVLIQDADLELDPQEYGRLLEPILAGRTSVVFGSRFLAPTARTALRSRLANRTLTAVTNVLFRARLTDMETAYKVFRREVLDGIRLRCVAFDFEPEFTAKVLLKGYQIVEVPISYHPRRPDEGKKIRWVDGLDALYALLKCRLGAST
jgi:glycosyltransferase involved in cell wall biosynthesis